MTRTMVDALDPLNIPLDLKFDLIASYIDHSEIDSHGLALQRFPHKTQVTISAHVHPAQVLDVESGAALPSDVPGWMLSSSQCRTVYATADNFALVIQECAKAGVLPPMHWVAHWNDVADVPAGCVAHQYSNGPAGNPYDLSAVADYWPGIDPKPTPPKPPIPPEDDMANSMIIYAVDMTDAPDGTVWPGKWVLYPYAGAYEHVEGPVKNDSGVVIDNEQALIKGGAVEGGSITFKQHTSFVNRFGA